MSTLSEPKPKPKNSTDDGVELDHIGRCCDDFTSLCGIDMTDWELDTGPIDMGTICIVCLELTLEDFCTGCNK